MVKLLAGITIGVIGGDKRDLVLIKELVQQGAEVKVVGFPLKPELKGAKLVESLPQAMDGVDVVILPMSGTDENGIIKSSATGSPLVINDEAMSCLRPGTLLLVGFAKPILKDLAAKYKLKLVETAELDEIAILNSIPTAEGAIQIAMENLPITIHGSKALVLGMGRCGSTLACFLRGLGAQVYIAARRPADLARGRVHGFKTLTYSELNQQLGQIDVIFNTVPTLVLDINRLALLNPNCLIIDLASFPGGTDFSAAEKLGIKAIFAPGLPGKVAPYTAGKILADNYPGIILREMNGFLEVQL